MRWMVHFASTFVLAGALWLGQGGAFAQDYAEDFAEDKSQDDVMMGILFFGKNDTWEGVLRGGTYYLGNQTERSAVGIYFVNNLPEMPGGLADATVSIDVGGQFIGERSGAGIVYRLSAQEKTYFAFLLLADDRYGFFLRDREGFKLVEAGEHEAIAPGRMNRLTILSDGPKLDYFINGVHVGSFAEESIVGGSVGLIAKGTGHHYFDNFEVSR